MVHLIEDDAGLSEAVSFLLRVMGYEVIAYSSGLNFLEYAPERPDGCVVTDVAMPGLDGIALTAQLRGMGLNMPTIVMSGRSDETLAPLASRAGAVEFIEKPFDDDVLLEALRRIYPAREVPSALPA